MAPEKSRGRRAQQVIVAEALASLFFMPSAARRNGVGAGTGIMAGAISIEGVAVRDARQLGRSPGTPLFPTVLNGQRHRRPANDGSGASRSRP